MTTLQLREELFREMNPLLDSERVLEKMLSFVRDLIRIESHRENVADGSKNIAAKRTRQVPASFKKLRGIVSITDEDMAKDERLAYIMER